MRHFAYGIVVKKKLLQELKNTLIKCIRLKCIKYHTRSSAIVSSYSTFPVRCADRVLPFWNNCLTFYTWLTIFGNVYVFFNLLSVRLKF